MTYTNASGIVELKQDPTTRCWRIVLTPHNPKGEVLFTAHDFRELRWLMAEAEVVR